MQKRSTINCVVIYCYDEGGGKKRGIPGNRINLTDHFHSCQYEDYWIRYIMKKAKAKNKDN